ncbi:MULTISPECIES: hypothetical protein [unclassified Limnothrix]|nr:MULTISPECIES: hypothetical protein [unclassified Limnothrix]
MQISWGFPKNKLKTGKPLSQHDRTRILPSAIENHAEVTVDPG